MKIIAAIIGSVSILAVAAGAGVGIGMATSENFRNDIYNASGVVSEQKYEESQKALSETKEINNMLISEYKKIQEENSQLKTENETIYNEKDIIISENEALITKLAEKEKYNAIVSLQEQRTFISYLCSATGSDSFITSQNVCYSGSDLKTKFEYLCENKQILGFETGNVYNIEFDGSCIGYDVPGEYYSVSDTTTVNVSFLNYNGEAVDFNSLENETVYNISIACDYTIENETVAELNIKFILLPVSISFDSLEKGSSDYIYADDSIDELCILGSVKNVAETYSDDIITTEYSRGILLRNMIFTGNRYSTIDLYVESGSSNAEEIPYTLTLEDGTVIEQIFTVPTDSAVHKVTIDLSQYASTTFTISYVELKANLLQVDLY